MNRRQFLIPLTLAVGGGSIFGVRELTNGDADPTTGSGNVVVVKGVSVSGDAVHTAPAAVIPSPTGFLPDLGPLTVTERQALMATEQGDRAPRAEASLKHHIGDALPGMTIKDVVCRGGLCQVTAGLQIAPGGSIDSAVARVMHGNLQRSFQNAGFEENGSITIDVDDAGNLHFVQYLQPSTA